MRKSLSILLATVACGLASPAAADLQVEIQSPSADFTANEGAATVEVEGIASAIGGVRYLDMIFVMDTSQSLRSTDPKDYRSLGAIGLVRNLSPRSDIKIGVVSFDNKGELAQPLTSDRDAAVQALRGLPAALLERQSLFRDAKVHRLPLRRPARIRRRTERRVN